MTQVTTFKAELMTSEDCKWHNVPNGSYSIGLFDTNNPGINPGWFPVRLISTVSGGRFTGIIHGEKEKEIFINGTMGSASIATTNPQKVVEILQNNGYKLVTA